MPYFARYFQYIKKYFPYVAEIVKLFAYFVSDGNKLVDARDTCLRTRLMRRNQIILDQQHLLSSTRLENNPFTIFLPSVCWSKFCVTLSISFSVKLIFDKGLGSVFGCRTGGIMLLCEGTKSIHYPVSLRTGLEDFEGVSGFLMLLGTLLTKFPEY